MNYQEAIRYVIERSGYDRGFVANPFDAEAVGLHRTEMLLEMLDNPQRHFASIHIAGSKGKGSTAAMLDSVLRTAGYRVGLYTTPHLHTFRERIRIAGQTISEELFAELTEELVPLNARLAEARPDWGEATAFEVSTALTFLAFARSGVDAGVIEVGLGGRLDATNVLNPALSVISSISLDHTGILGNTLGEIAFEKAGIIKPGRPVVTAALDSEAATKIESIATERGSQLILGGRDWQVTGGTDRFTVTGPRKEHSDLRVGLAGQHQVENAGLAVVALDEFEEQGFHVSDRALRIGLEEVTWPGRFEVARRQPVVVVDGAHNVDSARRLAATLQEIYPNHTIRFVLGIARDKDIPGMMRHFVPFAAEIVTIASRSPRAAPPERLIEAARAVRADLPAGNSSSVAAALSDLSARSDSDDVICVTGSLYVVAEAREALGLAEPADFEQELLYR